MQQPTGVGAALRRARIALGVSIEEASRDTRIRPEVLDGLEEERFESFRGAVHVRGFIRTYARYLGLPADRLVDRFQRGVPDGDETPPPMEETVIVPGRDGHRLARSGAAAILVLAAIAGLVSSRSGASDRVALGSASAPPTSVPTGVGVLVSITALRDVGVTVTVDDDDARRYDLVAGESRSFEGAERVVVTLDSGASAGIVVDGIDLGAPGAFGAPWSRVFVPEDVTLSPAPVPTPSVSADPSGSPTGTGAAPATPPAAPSESP